MSLEIASLALKGFDFKAKEEKLSTQLRGVDIALASGYASLGSVTVEVGLTRSVNVNLLH